MKDCGVMRGVRASFVGSIQVQNTLQARSNALACAVPVQSEQRFIGRIGMETM